MKILALDSSTKTVSVSILEEDRVIGETYADIGLTHTQTLVPIIKNLLQLTNINLNDIELFVVTNGPGSFTGVRIGISTLKGMLIFDNKKCIPVSSLLALAYNINFTDCYICACIEARRGNVYNAIFKNINNNFNNNIVRVTEDRFINIDNLSLELSSYNDKNIIFVGDGAEICYNYILSNYKIKNLILLGQSYRYIKASNVGIAGLNLYKNKLNIVNSEDLIPNYLKLCQAQENLLKKGDIK